MDYVPLVTPLGLAIVVVSVLLLSSDWMVKQKDNAGLEGGSRGKFLGLGGGRVKKKKRNQ